MAGSSKTDDCEEWDRDCVIGNVLLDNEKHITGYHLIPTCAQQVEPPKKQLKMALELNQELVSQIFVNNFKNSWQSNERHKEQDIELIVDPFKVCVVQNFLHNTAIIDKLVEEFNEINWNKRSLDLYDFFQSVDLKNLNFKHISIMYEFLKTDVKNWVESVTGLELTNISATCSFYGDTDYLLVHDDQQEDRSIAFVFYFTTPRGWEENNGGALELFCKDDAGQPLSPIRSILPCNNQFVFFQVTNDSYHQVSEVLNKNDCRMSINGWFHTKVPPIFKAPSYVPLSNGLYGDEVIGPQAVVIDLENWINSEYLESDTTEYIQQHIEEYSEISLNSYFKSEVFQEVVESLQNNSIEWTPVGPANRCCYEVAPREHLPLVVQQFITLIRSFEMFNLLKQYTDLDLVSLRYELQRWKPGCYSLLSDYDWSQKTELDLVVFFGCPKNAGVIGGQIMYVSTEEEIQQALITLEPEENNLNVVFRDTARISKYVSKYSSCSVYYVLICSYSE